MDPLRPLVTRQLTRGQLIALDVVLAAGIGQILIAGAVNHPRGYHPLPPAVGVWLAVVLAVAVALRRWRPRAALAVALAVSVASALAGFLKDPLLAVALVLYVVALTSSARRARAALLTVEATIGVTAAVDWFWRLGLAHRSSKGELVLGAALVQLVAWTLGTAVRSQREYAAGLREQELRRAETRLAHAERTVAQERLRIAQELHDVLAHSMSVIAVQAGVGRHVLAAQPAEAGNALDAIETTSRASLLEMRRLLGVLRDGTRADAADVLSPSPGLADLPELVRRTENAGLRVDLEINGVPRDLPVAVQLAAYRIVQEALTNVVRHAGAAESRVVLAYGRDDLRIEVTDPGGPVRTRAVAPVDTAGHGLIGMRERVALYGGEFSAGPSPVGGFRVAARLPTGAP